MRKYFKSGVFILSTIPFLFILYKIYFNKLGPEPVKEITHFTGEWTLIFICLTLSMTPLKRLTNLTMWVSFRRMLGLFVFFYASLHLLTYIGIDYRFNWQPILDDVFKKKYIFIGFAAWVLLIPLAITSSQKMIKLLKNNWNHLFTDIYLRIFTQLDFNIFCSTKIYKTKRKRTLQLKHYLWILHLKKRITFYYLSD